TLVRHIHKNLGEQLHWKLQNTAQRGGDSCRGSNSERCRTKLELPPRACNRAFENPKCQERMERDGSKEGFNRRKLLTSRPHRVTTMQVEFL
ncbi:hypothetical protein FQA47_024548, partial [Oryzias melastigma]